MIKISILIFVLGLVQFPAASGCYAASSSEAATKQWDEQRASDPELSTDSGSVGKRSAAWPPYQPAARTIPGELNLAFETETEPLAEALLEQFRKNYPELEARAYNAQLDAVRAWWEVSDAVGLFKLPMTDEERAAFERKYGYPPTMLPVAMSGIAIVVHPENPIVKRGLSLAELDAIFSETRHRGHPEVSLWGDVGLGGEWELRPIYKYRVTEINTLHDLFQRRVMEGGEFKTIATRESTSADVVKRIGGYEAAGGTAASEGNVDAIGFVYVEDLTDGVQAVPISPGDDQPAVFPSAENLETTRYPLRQYTYLYLTEPPDSTREKAQSELVRFVFSQQGQQLLRERNYTPAPRAAVLGKLRSIGVRTE